MTPPQSKYGPLHALAAGAVLVYAVLSNGFAAFWQQFLHGINIELNEKTLLPLLGFNTLFFGGLFLILWVSTLFLGSNKRDWDNGHLARCEHWDNGRLARCEHWDNGHLARCEHWDNGHLARCEHWDNGRLARCARLTLLSVIPICLIALGLNWASGELLSRLAGIDLSDQDLVKVIASNTLSPGSKAILYSFVLLEAPLLEEPLFRGVVFGGMSKVMPVWAAMGLSGFLFALVHINAATFIPLWFLGIAFAWLYARTGTLLAPMAVHFTFNALNLILCLL